MLFGNTVFSPFLEVYLSNMLSFVLYIFLSLDCCYPFLLGKMKVKGEEGWFLLFQIGNAIRISDGLQSYFLMTFQ